MRPPGQVWWIKRSWEQLLSSEFSFFRGVPPTASVLTPAGGRGSLYRLPLGDGGYAIARRYRRGGLIHHFTRDLYWERPFRPLTELIATEAARQRAIPTVEVLAAGVEHVAFGFYRGWLISREAEGFINLWEWLRSNPSASARQQGIKTVAQMTAQLHTAGIYHADLNLTNILITPQTLQSQVFIIDFDRARVFTGPLSSRRRKKNLRRLRRSLRKLDPQEQFFSLTDLEIFCDAYHARCSS
ncbi:MAG: lipopolysaccharide kinase InaA family protein [Candidatus Binatia bacterium]